MTTIYIGPYLVIPAAPRASTVPTRECSNHCGAPAIDKPAKFCGNCGGAVLETKVPVVEVKPVPIQSLDRKWEDFMFSPEYGQRHPKGDMWLPNLGGHGILLERGAEDSFTPVLLADLDSNAMLEKAQRAFGKLVEALKEDFGIEPFWEVGVVAYT
jgi:hypothetical protein